MNDPIGQEIVLHTTVRQTSMYVGDTVVIVLQDAKGNDVVRLRFPTELDGKPTLPRLAWALELGARKRVVLSVWDEGPLPAWSDTLEQPRFVVTADQPLGVGRDQRLGLAVSYYHGPADPVADKLGSKRWVSKHALRLPVDALFACEERLRKILRHGGGELLLEIQPAGQAD